LAQGPTVVDSTEIASLVPRLTRDTAALFALRKAALARTPVFSLDVVSCVAVGLVVMTTIDGAFL
jgi:hypothetical protein